MRKYKLTDETKTANGTTLYRIEALRDFNDVKAGDKGGFVRSEESLSHDGTCWVYDDAMATDCTRIMDDASLHDYASLRGHASLHGQASLHGHASLRDHASIRRHAALMGHALIRWHEVLRGQEVMSI